MYSNDSEDTREKISKMKSQISKTQIKTKDAEGWRKTFPSFFSQAVLQNSHCTKYSRHCEPFRERAFRRSGRRGNLND
jgi:hypothetical protein